MPVIINDFEIEVEQPQQQPSRGDGAGESSEQQQPPQSKPEVTTSVVRLQRERIERVRAD
jgi:hypothetical protein